MTNLDNISRTRTLTMAESIQLERNIEKRKHGSPNRMIGQGTSQPLPSNRTIEAGDRLRRRDAEESNMYFVEALDRYFRNGGTA